jgi:hypothetical protein
LFTKQRQHHHGRSVRCDPKCDPKRVAPPECNMMVGESVLEQSANGG